MQTSESKLLQLHNELSRDEVGDLLKEGLFKLSLLDADISQTETKLLEQRRNRHVLERAILGHKAFLTPIRNLPREILSEIFLRCLATHRNPAMSDREAPLLLCCVCTLWRSIALSTPYLWASIHIVALPGVSLPTPPRVFHPICVEQADRQVEAVRKWLDRSSDLPLCIPLGLPLGPNDFGRDEVDDYAFDVVINEILPLSRRWREVEFRAYAPAFAKVKKLTREEIPLLESIYIDFLHFGMPDPTEPLWATGEFLQAPRLRKLTLLCAPDLQFLPLPWNQLTTLCLKSDMYNFIHEPPLVMEHVLAILAKCPLLTNCSFKVDSSREGDDLKRVSLLHLERLSIHVGNRGRVTPVIFRYLKLPALRHIEFKEDRYDLDHQSPSCLLELLSQVGSYIETLAIDPREERREDLHKSLRLVPNARTVHLRDADEKFLPPDQHDHYNYTSCVDDDLLDLLTPSDAKPDCLCPILEDFECNIVGFSDEKLLAFIKGRTCLATNNLVRLKRVRALFPRSPQIDINEKLKPSSKVDIHVNLTYRPPLPIPAWVGTRELEIISKLRE